MKNKIEKNSVAVSFIVVICVVGLFTYIIVNNKNEKENLSEVTNSENQFEVQNQNDTDITEEQLAPSTNQMEKISKNGDVLIMNYTGRFTNGTAFDSNVDPKFGHVSPFSFTLGKGMVIKGWDEGLVGMKVGEKKTLTIPPEKAYGPNDYNGIPGNSTLIFDVELVGIE
jgi:FKBP-type peptidyl-prolyl cis-trans isomerase